MNNSYIHRKEISKEDFKRYLKNQKSEVKWFWWHIVSDISGHSCFEILQANIRVGVFCVESSESPHIDIYIASKYRGRSFGFNTLLLLKSGYPSAKFKVNNRNGNSKEFFNRLVKSQIISLVEITDQFTIYQYV